MYSIAKNKLSMIFCLYTQGTKYGNNGLQQLKNMVTNILAIFCSFRCQTYAEFFSQALLIFALMEQ